MAISDSWRSGAVMWNGWLNFLDDAYQHLLEYMTVSAVIFNCVIWVKGEIS